MFKFYTRNRCKPPGYAKKLLQTIAVIILMAEAINANGKTIKHPPSIVVHGKVLDEQSRPLQGATITVKGTKLMVKTNANGEFVLEGVDENATISVSFVGYDSQEYKARPDIGIIKLIPSTDKLEEVNILRTGYQSINRERATGSFTQINNDLLNRAVSTSVLDRIKNIVPGIFVQDKRLPIVDIATNPSAKNTGILIRGKSTLNGSSEPLIVLDNFPYEGDINNINPNDIESVTILKDAAAASIWGARSGNGVIVITTKKGKVDQKTHVEFNTNITLSNKPDLNYSPNFLNAGSYIEVEQYLFDKGYFNAQLNDLISFPTVSPAVELMAKIKASASENERLNYQSKLNALKENDIRDDYKKYVYQAPISTRYSLGLRGGSTNMTYALSAGRDDNSSVLKRNGYSRNTVNIFNTYTPIKGLEFTVGVNYSQSTTKVNNDFYYGAYASTGAPYVRIFPYAQLANDNGQALPISRLLRSNYVESVTSKGFLDWNYRPLDEINLADNKTIVKDLILKFGALYNISQHITAQLNYQNERQTINLSNSRTIDTYYARDLINKFSVYNETTKALTYNFPKGGILDISDYDWRINNLRGQLNYNQNFNKHAITALIGSEIRELNTEGKSQTSYGYNSQFGTSLNNLNYLTSYPTNPSGSSFIPGVGGGLTGTLNRYLSYYANAAYSYDQRYTITISGRKDGANLFGAKTNDKITPLWSTGLGWNLNNENFYQIKWLPKLRLRATYGYNGNTYQNGSAYLVGLYSNSIATGAPTIDNTQAPNPQLRWEKIRNINLGIDFSTKNNRIAGSIEGYKKDGRDLIQPTILAPQTGFETYQANTASTKTNGVDIAIQSQNLTRQFKWSSNLFLSLVKDKVVKYDALRNSGSIFNFGGAVDKSSYALLSYKWAGLNASNGNPRGMLNGQISEDYNGIINNFSPDSLINSGSVIPTVYGGLRNDFSYKGFSLSVNMTYKLGYVFRRSSTDLNYTGILQNGQHTDYDLRWQKPGDENSTGVPSVVYPSNISRNSFYQYSQALIEKGDHVRLQDIKLSYTLTDSFLRKLKLLNFSVYAYANNLGIIWRENKKHIDPNAVGAGGVYPDPFSISFGLTTNF